MTADRSTATKANFLRFYVLLLVAAPLVWAAMHWLFDVPLAARLTNTDATFFSALGLNDSVFLRTLLFAGLIYPVLEEVVFRGALQGFLLDRLPSSVRSFAPSLQPLNQRADHDDTPELEQSFAKRRYYMLIGPISLANVLTSVAFATLHLLSQPPLWAFLVFFPSLAFGWTREASSGLLLPVVLHVFYNLGFFLLYT